MIRLIKPRKQNDSASIVEPSFLTKLFASGLCTGYVPAGSGTLASALAGAIYYIPGFESPFIFGSVLLLSLGLGIVAASVMEKRYGHDPAEVTIDEVVGMWISVVLLPKKLFIVLAAFFLFRFFDIVKPSPAKKFDSMHGGLSIMMDDVVAGIYTNLSLQIILLVPTIKEFILRSSP